MHILVIGAGDIGFYLAKRLSEEQHDIVMIEADPHKVARASEQLDAFVVEGNGGSYRVLKQAGLDKIEIVAAMTDSDEANLMACKIAKKSGVRTTVARVRHPQFTQPDFILSPEELGTDLILHPEKQTADAIVRLIRKSSATYAVDFEGGRIELLGLRLDKNSRLLNIPLKYLGQETENLHMRVVAINRNYQTIIPRGDDAMQAGDQIFVAIDHAFSNKFIQFAGKTDEPSKNIMILGGGLIAQFIGLAVGHEVNIKIIEKNISKARRLADLLPNALIIHGDGTDFDLLNHEDISEMDAFIAVTGNDEINIITTLLAQHSNVTRSVALINKSEYLAIASKIGMDAIVSKQSLTVNAVQRYIHSQEVANIAGLPGIEAQIIEYIAGEGCPITCHELRNVPFPRRAIVGLVMRQEDVIIPHGNTQIQPGDKVLVFAMPDTLPTLSRLFAQEKSRSRLSQLLHL
ncbi:MAG: Trk system potassium transporter TrkA [Anaerolineae bacterium]